MFGKVDMRIDIIESNINTIWGWFSGWQDELFYMKRNFSKLLISSIVRKPRADVLVKRGTIDKGWGCVFNVGTCKI